MSHFAPTTRLLWPPQTYRWKRVAKMAPPLHLPVACSSRLFQIKQYDPLQIMASKITTISLSTKNYQDGSEAMTSPHRVKIYFQDDALRARSQFNAQQLLMSASGPDGDNDNNAFMAKKALKYRKVFERMSGVDVNSPGFDASKFLGVDWCKTICLKTFCEDQQ